MVCLEGQRSCTAGVWGICSNDRQVKKFAPAPASAGLRLQDLADAGVSCNDACDPSCSKFVDTSTNLDAGPDFTNDDGGLTLSGHQGGSACTDIVISPSSATLRVTGFAPLTSTPDSVNFTATCGAGGPAIDPSWVLAAADSDVAHITPNGVLTLLTGVTRTLTVTAASTSGTATASVNVVVDTTVVDPGCEAAASAFDAAPAGGVDPGTTLYPYAVPARPVVYPPGIGAPLVQWSTGGRDADCVKLSLSFPQGAATPTFRWSRIYAPTGGKDPKRGSIDPSQPAADIDAEVWDGFSRSAAGQTGEIIVQRRRAGGSVMAPMPSIPLTLASDAVRGTVYYTQYTRRFRDDFNRSTSSICGATRDGAQPDLDVTNAAYKTSVNNGCTGGNCDANTGPVCPVGNCTQVKNVAQATSVQTLDLSNTSAGPSNPFTDQANTAKCPVCHSISADGTTFVASDYSSAGVQTIANIGSYQNRPALVTYADAPTYSWTSNRGDLYTAPSREQSRGLSYAALTPDGRFALQGPNFWGNSRHDVHLGQGNIQDAGYDAGGKRYFLLDTDEYQKNVGYASSGPLPAHSATATTLTGSTSVALIVDGVALGQGDSVLVKDESALAQNGVYEVTSPGGASGAWQLTRRWDNDDPGEPGFGARFRVEAGTTNAGKYFHSATSAAVTPGVTPLQLSLHTTAMAATSSTLPAGYTASVGADGVMVLSHAGAFDSAWIDFVPVESGMSILVKDEVGINAANNGLYFLVDGNADPWQLRRRSEADADPEVCPLMRVRVNQGTRFGGKTFVLNTTGPISLNVSALSFVEDTALDEGTKYDQGGTPSTLPTMMYPVFSPDGKALVYVNGDSDIAGVGAATGWRRGLSLLNFDARRAQPFSGKRRLINTYSAGSNGMVMKWPFFEPDSRSVVFVETSPDEFCPWEAYAGMCTGPDCSASTSAVSIDSDVERACFQLGDPTQLGYGNGAPTARGYWPGRLQSVDSVSLRKTDLGYLNGGLATQDPVAFAADDGKAFQPTVLPFAAAGYRWVIFTSTRAYGNQLNAVGTHFSCATSLLWMAALDDSPAGAIDRSHPAFLVTGQNMRSILSAATSAPYGRHYINERGFVVPTPCRGEHEACSVNADCCDGTGAAPSRACRLNTDTDPPSRSCEAVTSCIAVGDACTTSADCCGNTPCVAGVCSAAPFHEPAVFERVFAANCSEGYKVRWGNFEWHADAPSSTRIVFSAHVSPTTDFSGTDRIAVGQSDSTNENPPPAAALVANVGDLLTNAGVASGAYLLIRMDFRPSDDRFTAPVLYDWVQRYDCVAAE